MYFKHLLGLSSFAPKNLLQPCLGVNLRMKLGRDSPALNWCEPRSRDKQHKSLNKIINTPPLCTARSPGKVTLPGYVKSQSSILYLLMSLIVPPHLEEQLIPSRAALLEQVKNLQPILDSTSIQGTHIASLSCKCHP